MAAVTLGYVAWLVQELVGFQLFELPDEVFVDGEVLLAVSPW